jgi:serine protease
LRARIITATRLAVAVSISSSLALTACAVEDDLEEDSVSVLATSGPGRFIVAFQPGQVAAGRAAVVAAGGQAALELPEQAAQAAYLPAAAAAALAQHPAVAYVEEDAPRYPLSHGAGESSPYGIAMVQADQLSDASAGNRKVCIIDSGYARTHEDLPSGSHVTGDSDSGTGNWFEDKSGHGTHVAGTIAALHNDRGVVGVNPGDTLKLHIVKVFGDDGTWTYSSSLVTAANKCRDAGANVISMSLGGGRASTTESNAFANLYNGGILSIAAAGNDGNTAKSYPASYPSVVSVAALDSTKTVADFSQKNDAVELAAPGVGVLSTVGYIDDNRLDVGSDSFAGGWVEGAAYTSTSGVSGALVDGGKCTATSGSFTGKVVLCQRGDITFADKVKNVANSGGAAAVIYNNVTSDPSCGDFGATLGGTSTIPAISVTCDAGAQALAQAGKSGTVISLPRDYSKSGYASFNGTSMATPHVSGVAALVWSHNTGWTNAQLRDALQKSAQDLGAAGKDNSYGYGLVQARAALDFLTGGAEPPPPPPPPPPAEDTEAPIISDVASTKLKGNQFRITWATNEPATSEVRFSTGQVYSSSALTSSHSMSFNGKKGATYTYFVASTDAAGNRSESGPFLHQN